MSGEVTEGDLVCASFSALSGTRLTSSQRKLWQELSKPLEYFKDCKRLPANTVPAKNHPRWVYFLECENIVFKNEKGKYIWSTKDEKGQMEVPAGIAGFMRVGRWNE